MSTLDAAARVSISESARYSLRMESTLDAAPVGTKLDASDNDPVTALIKSMVEMLTGRAIKVFSAANLPPLRAVPSLPSPDAGNPERGPAANGQGLAYDASYLHEEHQQLSFSAHGVIRTSDGAEIRFDLDLEMESYYREESSVSVRMGTAAKQDPLVLNFSGTTAELNNRYIRFDLDGDGEADLLPGLAQGSAYLVLDRDGNGRIDSGRELFGPVSGNGFSELAALDGDGNGWIDDADPLFSQLGVWNPADDQLRSLREVGVGALALQRALTPFAQRAPDRSELGMLRETGFYLGNDGSAGTMQELDLSVR